MIKMDINANLDMILLKYGLIQETLYDKALGVIQKLEEKSVSNHKIGIYGVGIEVEGLLHFISKHSKDIKIDVCFDKTIRTYKYKKIIRDSIVRPIESITDMNVDYLILGSYVYRSNFFENLSALGFEGEVIDLFDLLKGYINDHYVDYKKVFRTRQEYLKAKDNEKIKLLQEIIKQHILLKDFVNAFYYIDMYISHHFAEFAKYKKLKKELELLLEKIKENIKARKKKDIIINWIDAISYYDVSEFSFLKEKMEKGVCFENAYTVMPWTTETTKTILFGEYPIEGKLFLKEYLSKGNVKLLKILKNKRYKFCYFGMPKFAKLFDESVVTCVHCYESKFSGSSQKQWDALDALCRNERSLCILIHTLRETHEPFICGEGDTLYWFGSTEQDWNQETCRKQAKISGEYINAQLAFYEEFYKENAVNIYMSDHGRVGNSPMSEAKTHIMLIVNGKDILHRYINNMFSLVKFPDLIEKIISENDDWDDLTDYYVLIENLDAYSELSVRDTLSGRLKKEEMYQCRGIITEQDKFYLYANGKEYYFPSRESNQNEINNPVYKSRIMELKKLCQDRFINIYRYEKFKYSRQLYTENEIDLNKFTFI